MSPSTLRTADESKLAQPKEEASDELDPVILFGGRRAHLLRVTMTLGLMGMARR